MITRQQLIRSCDELLQPGSFKDYCPNGLQVEGKENISKIITGVTASQALIEQAVQQNADAVIVHHGYFWKGEDSRVIGIKKQRLQTLLAHDINLIAYHLPLDAHKEVGNNIQLAKQLGWLVDNEQHDSLIMCGTVESQSGRDFKAHLDKVLKHDSLHIPAERNIQRIAWCTGAAQSYIEEAIGYGVDAFITGEVSEPTVHIARENNIHFFSAGHHATERYGVKALGEYLHASLGIDVSFVDLYSPV